MPVKREPSPHDRAIWWVRGWRVGAAFLSIPPDIGEGNADFNDGRSAGRAAAKASHAAAEKKYGVKFSVIRPA